MSWFKVDFWEPDHTRASLSVFDDIGHGATFESFARELGAVQSIDLVLNSNGGSSTTALQVFEFLDGREVTTTIYRASSSAILLCLLGRGGIASSAGSYLVHSPRAPLIYSTAAELRSWAQVLDSVTEKVKAIYLERSKATEAQIDTWFNGEDHYLTPEQFVQFGFATEVFEPAPVSFEPTAVVPAGRPATTADERLFLSFLRSFEGLQVSDRGRLFRELNSFLTRTKTL